MQKSDDTNKRTWRPRNPSNRIIAQKSVFVQPKKGFVEPDVEINVPKSLKHPILNHLRKSHGISTESIYNDLHGFIKNQIIHQSAYTEFAWGLTYQNQGDKEKAIEHYSKALKLDQQHAEAYTTRGVAYWAKGDYDHAIHDFDKAIALKPDLAEAYCLRGVTCLILKKWEKARSDLTTAKNKRLVIANLFSSIFGSISNFEQKYNVQLPDDIAEMLTP